MLEAREKVTSSKIKGENLSIKPNYYALMQGNKQ